MKKTASYLLSLIAFCILLTSCSGKDSVTPQPTIICGLIKDIPENAHIIAVNYCDPLSEERQFVQDLTESNGSFHTVHAYTFPQNITIRFQNHFINLFVNPGDSVFIAIDGKQFLHDRGNAVIFSGDNAQLNKQLYQWTSYIYRQAIPEFNDNATTDDYILHIKQAFNTLQDTINTYSLRSEMSQFMKEWALTDYKYVVANFLQDYDNDEEERWRVFTDPIFDIYNENNMHTMYFQYHVDVCVNTFIKKEPLLLQYLQDNEHAAFIHSFLNELKAQTPAGTVQDMMLYKGLYEFTQKQPNVFDSIPELQSSFTHPLFYELLKQLSAETINKQPQLIIPTGKKLKGISYLDADTITPLEEIELLPYLIEKYPEKILYIDAWATWCGPCLEEMQYTPDIQTYFKEKDVVFINLCMESEADKWVKTVKQKNIKGENYYLDKNTSITFRGENNLSGYPSYLLIDKKGHILYPAERPSHAEVLIRQIDTYLKQ